MRVSLFLGRRFLTALLGVVLLSSVSPAWADATLHWYKGNTHAHTTWSDGKSTPEYAVNWYKTHGYNFATISDHGDFIISGFEALEATYNTPGQFMLMRGEELTTSVKVNDVSKSVHINGLNLGSQITVAKKSTVAETINSNIALIAAQNTAARPTLSTINHPNFNNYSILPEEIAQAAGTRFFEVLNTHSASIHNNGDSTHPGMEKVWDIVNTIRMVNMGMLPMFGVAADDTHEYVTISASKANPGRSWIQVRAADLSAASLINAMNDGDFYCSTGVELGTLEFDKTTGTLTVSVVPKAGATYYFDFIGTPVGTSPAKNPDGTYSADLGKVLATTGGAGVTSASYTLTGGELYVRALIRSNIAMTNPPGESETLEQAWTQPVGSWMVVPEPSTWIMVCGMAAVWAVRRRRGK